MTSLGVAGLSDYEKQRLELIARNRARLLALGVQAAVETLASLPKPTKYVLDKGLFHV